ncbi:MAG TPA: PfkB family carbohydrate kinase [Anaerolineae bacterium]|nr:PfkB family carbohydrate kinase [Anaerolineae bacterium]
MSDSAPDFVVVGHICQDLLPTGGLSLGGSVSYAATTALQMGYRVGIVTSAGPEMDLQAALPGAEILCDRAAETTLFENIYHNGQRTQILHRQANLLTCRHIPSAWRRAPMAYVGSIDQEIDDSVFHCFKPGVKTGVMPQGFFRKWDEHGHVYFTEWTPADSVLRCINLLVLSELDVPGPLELARSWAEYIEIVVVTHAERGATVFQAGQSRHYPARPARQVDPTGAGDVFAAAFLIRLTETGDAGQAADFANTVASFSVEGPGVSGIPERERVKEYLRGIR